MIRNKKGWMEQRAWLVAAAVVVGLSLLLSSASIVQAEETPQLAARGLAQSQIFNDDLTVRSEQVIDGDVVVYNGDVEIERNGKILGNLTVYSGDVDVADGGMVHGNLTSWSGNVNIDGRVDGSIAAMSGDIELGDKAIVGGDISSMSGHIKQRAGAAVSGSILHGPDLKLPALSGLPWMRGFEVRAPAPVAAPSMMERAIGFLGPRLFVAILLLGLAVAGATGLIALRSRWVLDVHQGLGRQPALSFAAGLLVNVLVVAVAGVLYISVCLRPPALLLGLGLAALNIAGWAAVGYAIGGQLAKRAGRQWSPAASTALGVLIPGAAIAFLWIFGGCLAFFAYLGALSISSFGAGAVLVHILKLGGPSGAPVVPSTPAPPAPAPSTPDTPVVPVPDLERAVETPVTVPPPDATASSAPSEAVAQPTTVAEAVEAPSSVVVIEPVVPTASVVPSVVPLVADFTSIPGIGAKLNQRLHEAGVRTFADLAGQTPEALAAILGWSADRVARSGVIEQAKVTAAAG